MRLRNSQLHDNIELTSEVNSKIRVIVLRITYKNNKLEKICTDHEVAEREFDKRMADKIRERINQLSAADSVEWLIQKRIGRCHPLVQNRKGQYAMDLVHPYRLVFKKENEEIQIVKVIEIVDYH